MLQVGFAAFCIAIAGAGAGALGLLGRRLVGSEVAKALAWTGRRDVLTGLFNRSGFEDEIETQLTRLGPDEALALIVFRLEGLSTVQALEGYAPVEDIWIKAARLLRRELGEDGRVARFDGLFAAIIASHNDDHLVRRVQAMNAGLTALLEDAACVAGARVTAGGALYPGDARSFEDVLKASLIALDWAAADAVEGLAFFEPFMRERLAERTRLERDLKRAIEAGEVEPFFQPIVALETGRIESFEILARWRHPTLGPIEPNVFIPLAERTGQIGPLTFNLLRRAASEAKARGIKTRLALNLPPALLAEPGLGFRVLQLLSATGLAPSQLAIELTETAPIKDLAQTQENIALLRARGVRLALDDFGTGHSSMARLRDLPADTIKIDQCFAGAIGDRDTQEIVAAMIGLARKLKIDVLAEGVETLEQANTLRRLGCALAQGYYFGHAQDARALASCPPASAPSNDNHAQSGAA